MRADSTSTSHLSGGRVRASRRGKHTRRDRRRSGSRRPSIGGGRLRGASVSMTKASLSCQQVPPALVGCKHWGAVRVEREEATPSDDAEPPQPGRKVRRSLKPHPAGPQHFCTHAHRGCLPSPTAPRQPRTLSSDKQHSLERPTYMRPPLPCRSALNLSASPPRPPVRLPLPGLIEEG